MKKKHIQLADKRKKKRRQHLLSLFFLDFANQSLKVALEIATDAEPSICPKRRVAGKSQLALAGIALEIRSRGTVAAFKIAHGFSMSVESRKKNTSRQRAALKTPDLDPLHSAVRPSSEPTAAQFPVVQHIALNAGVLNRFTATNSRIGRNQRAAPLIVSEEQANIRQ